MIGKIIIEIIIGFLAWVFTIVTISLGVKIGLKNYFDKKDN